MYPTNTPFTSVIGLGAIKAEYRLPMQFKRTALVICVPFFMVALVLMTTLDPIVVGVALLFGAAGTFQAHRIWRDWPLAAAVYENGFAYYTRQGLKQFRWDHIQAVQHQVVQDDRPSTHIYTIQTYSSEALVLDARLPTELGEAIQMAVSTSKQSPV